MLRARKNNYNNKEEKSIYCLQTLQDVLKQVTFKQNI